MAGFVTAPLMGRGSRSMQVFFVNGRFIKSQLLTAALEEGYRNQIMKGKFPGCVLSVTLPVTAVDVNVHPAKTQVKFAREQEVFDAVYHTVLDAWTGRAARLPPRQGAAPDGGLPAGLLPDHGRQDLPAGRRKAGQRRARPWPARNRTRAPPGWDSGAGGRPPGWRTAPGPLRLYRREPRRAGAPAARWGGPPPWRPRNCRPPRPGPAGEPGAALCARHPARGSAAAEEVPGQTAMEPAVRPLADRRGGAADLHPLRERRRLRLAHRQARRP